MRKHYFLLWTKETAFFPYFHHGIIFYSAELFDCAVNFKFYMNIFVFLNINTNQTSKQQYLNLEAVIYFGISRTKRFWKKSVRPTVSQVFYPLRVFLRILVTFSRPVFCRTSRNLICNKFAILKNRKILKSDKTFYVRANIGNLCN